MPLPPYPINQPKTTLVPNQLYPSRLLLYVPINPETITAYLNGLQLQQNVDFYYDAETNKVEALQGMLAQPGDHLEIQYATDEEMMPVGYTDTIRLNEADLPLNVLRATVRSSPNAPADIANKITGYADTEWSITTNNRLPEYNETLPPELGLNLHVSVSPRLDGVQEYWDYMIVQALAMYRRLEDGAIIGGGGNAINTGLNPPYQGSSGIITIWEGDLPNYRFDHIRFRTIDRGDDGNSWIINGETRWYPEGHPKRTTLTGEIGG